MSNLAFYARKNFVSKIRLLTFSYGQNNPCIARRVSDDNLDTSVSKPGFRKKIVSSVLDGTLNAFPATNFSWHAKILWSRTHRNMNAEKLANSAPCNGYSQLQIFKLPVGRKKRQQVTCNTYRHNAHNVVTLTTNKTSSLTTQE